MLSGGQGIVDTGHSLADASVPRVVSTVSTARVAISSMGKGSPPEGGSPGQEQAKGHRPGVETSGYGEHQGMVESDPRNAKGSGESHVSDSHVRAHVRQSKGPCHEAIPESSVIKKSLSSQRG